MADVRSAGAAAYRSWGRWYVRRMMSRGLDGVHVRGLEEAREVVARSPTIVAANHVCWWDGLLFVHLCPELGGRGAVLVDQEQLDRFAFFKPFGAIGIDRRSALSARKGFASAAGRLKGPGDILWVFPQGEYTEPHRRPLGLSRGVEALARRTGAVILPLAVQYPFLAAPQPAAFVRFGGPVQGMAELEQALVEQLDGIDADLADRAALPARSTLASRALARITGWMGVGHA